MDDRRLERIEVKIDDLADKHAETNVILSAQHVTLKEHMRRTNLLEKSVGTLNTKVNWAEGALKLLGLIALIGGLLKLIKVV